jgi:hypothetical protein
MKQNMQTLNRGKLGILEVIGAAWLHTAGGSDLAADLFANQMRVASYCPLARNQLHQ